MTKWRFDIVKMARKVKATAVVATMPQKGADTFRNTDLEVLRCAAVLLVVINHLNYPSSLNHYFLGYVGVDIFFAISGYIITLSLLNSLKKKQPTTTIIKAFWIKRVFRILPMAYLWTIVPIILALTFNATGSFPHAANLFRDGVANVTQTANFHWQACTDKPEVRKLCGVSDTGNEPLAPYWSLSTEEQFYLLFPLLLLLISRKKLLALLAFIPLALLFVDRQHHLFFILRFDAIAVGVLLAFAQTQKWYAEYYPRFLEKRGLGVVLLLALLLLIGLVPVWSVVSFSQSIVVVLAAAMVFIASFNADLFTRPFPKLRPFFLWMGDRSYGIYLVHVPSFLITTELYYRVTGMRSGHDIIKILIATALIVALVELSGWLVERPFRRLGRQLAKQALETAPSRQRS